MGGLVTVAALYVRSDSIYKQLPGVDCYDEERDARTYAGPYPVVAHPPCRTWGRMATFAKAPWDEHGLAWFAIADARRWGGVVEHPRGSRLFRELELDARGRDQWGGYLLNVDQRDWGHPAKKATTLYLCGIPLASAVEMIPARRAHTHTVASRLKLKGGQRVLPEMPKSQRDVTPPDFAHWLVSLARMVA